MEISGLCPFPNIPVLGLAHPRDSAHFRALCPNNLWILTALLTTQSGRVIFLPVPGTRLLLDIFQQCRTGCYSQQCSYESCFSESACHFTLRVCMPASITRAMWVAPPTLPPTLNDAPNTVDTQSIQFSLFQLDLGTCNVFFHPTLLLKLSVQVSVQSHFPIPCFVVLPAPTACLIISLLSNVLYVLIRLPSWHVLLSGSQGRLWVPRKGGTVVVWELSVTFNSTALVSVRMGFRIWPLLAAAVYLGRLHLPQHPAEESDAAWEGIQPMPALLRIRHEWGQWKWGNQVPSGHLSQFLPWHGTTGMVPLD